MGEAKLYVIPGSHPSWSAKLMLEHKGIPYKRVDLMPVISKGLLRVMRFPGNTVPALKLDGDRVQGSREIARELDRIKPDPPLFPSDPEQRVKVEEAETWGDSFQQNPRQLSWWAFKRDRSPLASYSEGARLGIPVGLAVKTGGPLVAAAAKLNEATDEERASRSRLASRTPRPDRRLDRRRGHGRRGAERGRLPDRAEHPARDDLR
jgi:glutathione S-transferase